MTRGAEFSPCGKYRYQLTRIWDESKKCVMAVGLNPSTANADQDDPTVQWLTKSLTSLGYGGFKIVNLYALISPNPKALRDHPNPWGQNAAWLAVTAQQVQEIIFCWGNFKEAIHRSHAMIAVYPDALCFGRNKNGSPWHPLAMMYKGLKPENAKLVRYAAAT